MHDHDTEDYTCARCGTVGHGAAWGHLVTGPHCPDCKPIAIAEFVAEGGAVCDVCGERMLIAEGCVGNPITTPRGTFLPIPFGSEANADLFPPGRCHDCGCEPGGYHHDRCDMERCPGCGDQYLSTLIKECGCYQGAVR
jgi:hypothetical protein